MDGLDLTHPSFSLSYAFSKNSILHRSSRRKVGTALLIASLSDPEFQAIIVDHAFIEAVVNALQILGSSTRIFALPDSRFLVSPARAIATALKAN